MKQIQNSPAAFVKNSKKRGAAPSRELPLCADQPKMALVGLKISSSVTRGFLKSLVVMISEAANVIARSDARSYVFLSFVCFIGPPPYCCSEIASAYATAELP